MRKPGPTQLGVLIACALTVVLLSFVNTVPKAKPQTEAHVEHSGLDLNAIIEEEKSLLKADQAGVVASLETAIHNETDLVRRGEMYDSLVKVLGAYGRYAFAAYYAEEKAKQNHGSGSDWMAAGERYRSACSFQKDEAHLPPLYESAIRCFTQALQLEPGNLDAKVGLGIAIVDGTSDPMKGITILREVEAADSNHINMQLALADFAVRSKQYDKAIARFEHVLRIKPEYYAIHLSLAELFEAQNNTQKVIYHLEAYAAVTDDPVMKAEIEKVLENLKAQNSGVK
jgi:tetratricopeptide (TPR) repeat protein